MNGNLVRQWIYESRLRIAAEFDGTGMLVSRFVYGTRRNVPDYMIRGNATYRILCDPTGSPRLIAESVTGSVAQWIDYDEFGNVILDTSPGFQPFGFGGGLYDADTEFVRFGARDYDPRTGRFSAKDPVRFEGGSANLYGYALSDPINKIDPSGRVVGVDDVAEAITIAEALELTIGAALELLALREAQQRLAEVTAAAESRRARRPPVQIGRSCPPPGETYRTRPPDPPRPDPGGKHDPPPPVLKENEQAKTLIELIAHWIYEAGELAEDIAKTTGNE